VVNLKLSEKLSDKFCEICHEWAPTIGHHATDGGDRNRWCATCQVTALSTVSALSVFLRKLVFYGAFVWARRALNYRWCATCQATGLDGKEPYAHDSSVRSIQRDAKKARVFGPLDAVDGPANILVPVKTTRKRVPLEVDVKHLVAVQASELPHCLNQV
jgi:hypothetical protein